MGEISGMDIFKGFQSLTEQSKIGKNVLVSYFIEISTRITMLRFKL